MLISTSLLESKSRTRRFLWLAFGLAGFTIVYNLAEGVVSTLFGFEDGALSLFGFGMDSFIEVISGLGIAHMVLRIQHDAEGKRDSFERTALKITGLCFYGLVGVLIVMSGYNLWIGHKPQTTRWGIIISVISILVMWALMRAKILVGKKLSSKAILADASCTKVCIYMSVVLLFSSAVYEWSGVGYLDILGTLALSYSSFKEGKECFDNLKSGDRCNCC
jgi:Cation efflux family